MNGGLPPKPTLRHMVAGIALVVVLIIAFLNIHVVLKYVGAALTFLPSKLGFFQVVSQSEVMPVDIHSTPTSVTFTIPGDYLIYTDDYSLLMINDAIIASKGRPWVNLTSASGDEIQISLVTRGMAIYDTPLARGRPVVSFTIREAGVYTLAHPEKPINIYIVPDYITGNEGKISFFIYLEIVVIALIIWALVQKSRAKRNRPNQPKSGREKNTHPTSHGS